VLNHGCHVGDVLVHHFSGSGEKAKKLKGPQQECWGIDSHITQFVKQGQIERGAQDSKQNAKKWRTLDMYSGVRVLPQTMSCGAQSRDPRVNSTKKHGGTFKQFKKIPPRTGSWRSEPACGCTRY
jgi:hypothetical protein